MLVYPTLLTLIAHKYIVFPHRPLYNDGMKAKYWLVISVVCVIILGSAVAVHMFMTPTLPPTANFADRIFDFLDKWASAGAPAIMLIGIIVALIIGVISLHQTRNIQINERRDRLLNEIIDWAVSAAQCDHDVDITMPTGGGKIWAKVSLSRILFKYNIVYAKSEYIKEISIGFGSNMQGAVTTVTKRLFDCVIVMQNRLDNLDDKDTLDKVEACGKLLKLNVFLLINAAGKIKTQGIG